MTRTQGASSSHMTMSPGASGGTAVQAVPSLQAARSVAPAARDEQAASLEDILRRSAASHTRICPRQVLGARMALLAGRELGLGLPRDDRRLLAIVETDGCFVDAITAATNCTIGRRTLRIEDYGKVAATFVDVESPRALRVHPRPDSRVNALRHAPGGTSRWRAQLIGYQRMPDAELLAWDWVELAKPLDVILGRPGVRSRCEGCGEEVINQREVVRDGRVLCPGCAGSCYYLRVFRQWCGWNHELVAMHAG